MSDKIYCGSAKIITTQYGELTKVSFHKEDINKMVQYMKGNSSGWINLVVKEKKEPQEGKPTHYLEVDTWKPEEKKQEAQANSVHVKPLDTKEVTPEMTTPSISEDGLPF